MLNTTYSALLSEVRAKRPLVHHITNYVTVNDCANVTICIGASPVMAHAGDEVAEMVSMAGALVLNIGTLDDQLQAGLGYDSLLGGAGNDSLYAGNQSDQEEGLGGQRVFAERNLHRIK